MSYLEAFDDSLPPGAQPILEGDIVLLGPGGAFAMEIIALRGDKAWVRDLDDGREGVVELATLRRFGLDAPGTLQ